MPPSHQHVPQLVRPAPVRSPRALRPTCSSSPARHAQTAPSLECAFTRTFGAPSVLDRASARPVTVEASLYMGVSAHTERKETRCARRGEVVPNGEGGGNRDGDELRTTNLVGAVVSRACIAAGGATEGGARRHPPQGTILHSCSCRNQFGTAVPTKRKRKNDFRHPRSFPQTPHDSVAHEHYSPGTLAQRRKGSHGCPDSRPCVL